MLVASALCLPAPAPSTRLHDPWAPLSLPFASVTAAALLWTAMRELRAAAAAAAADAGQDAATGEGAQSGDAGADSECDVSVADAGALQRVLTDLAVPLGVATTTTAAISEATVSRVVRRCCAIAPRAVVLHAALRVDEHELYVPRDVAGCLQTLGVAQTLHQALGIMAVDHPLVVAWAATLKGWSRVGCRHG